MSTLHRTDGPRKSKAVCGQKLGSKNRKRYEESEHKRAPEFVAPAYWKYNPNMKPCKACFPGAVTK